MAPYHGADLQSKAITIQLQHRSTVPKAYLQKKFEIRKYTEHLSARLQPMNRRFPPDNTDQVLYL